MTVSWHDEAACRAVVGELVKVGEHDHLQLDLTVTEEVHVDLMRIKTKTAFILQLLELDE